MATNTLENSRELYSGLPAWSDLVGFGVDSIAVYMYTCSFVSTSPNYKLYDLIYNYANQSYISYLHQIDCEQLAINFTTTADKRIHWTYQNYLLCTEDGADLNGGLEYMKAYCGTIDWNNCCDIVSTYDLDYDQVITSAISSSFNDVFVV